MRNRVKTFRKERGQVLILALIALLVLVLAIFILFDVSNIIRAKVKAQNAVDAAALTGANWQRHTLNLVGELNLINATTALMSDPNFMRAESDREDEEFSLDRAVIQRQLLAKTTRTINQMQQRVLFIVPLIGFGAAQQTAKNNGINANEEWGKRVSDQLDYVAASPFAQETPHRYNWFRSYAYALNTILQTDADGETSKGIAVLPNARMIGAPRVITVPPAGSNDFARFFNNHRYFEAIQANYWCWLREFLRMDFSRDDWWNGLTIRTNHFYKQSEYLPVHILVPDIHGKEDGSAEVDPVVETRWNDPAFNTALDDVIKKRNYPGQKLQNVFQNDPNPKFDPATGQRIPEAGVDARLNPLPSLSWAYYDEDRWMDYDGSVVSEWDSYLRRSISPRAAYYSGAVSRMDTLLSPVTVSGTLGVKNAEESDRTIGTLFQDSSAENIRNYAERIDNAQKRLKDIPHNVHANALAKPFGSVTLNGEQKPPHVTRVVLPVFTESSLIPMALENPGANGLANYAWYLFLREFVPRLGYSNSIEQAWNATPLQFQREISQYVEALKKMNDPQWRDQGITWLETETRERKEDDPPDLKIPTNEDGCEYWPSGGGPGHPNPMH